ncbi:MAG: DNA repair putative endonuclease MmcB [Caulobacter sp.]|nr:DNA repair putative endonuclease MmcB [Caulobacter sp.]MDP1967559.1 DNA repair putative endonuclease MmcB [Reyranella sp.]
MDVTLSIITVSRPETTLAVTRGAARLLGEMAYAPLAEVALPNGRRADLMALGPRGEIVIVEVKSSPEDFLTDRKWAEYAPFCDAFYFAVAPEFPADLIPPEPGLIVADGFGGAIVRAAPVTALVAARRKALTLAFARLAIFRG